MKDTQHGYSALSIWLHWLAAITMIVLFVLGQAAEDAADAERKTLLGLHISIAMSMNFSNAGIICIHVVQHEVLRRNY